MLERFIIRAANEPGTVDPLAAIDPKVLTGPMVSILFQYKSKYASYLRRTLLIACDLYFCSLGRDSLLAHRSSAKCLALRYAVDAMRILFPLQSTVCCSIALSFFRLTKTILRLLTRTFVLRDSRWIKGLVLFLLVADTANAVFDIWFTYDYNVVSSVPHAHQVHHTAYASSSVVQLKFGDKLAIVNATWVFNTGNSTSSSTRWDSS